MVEEKILVVDSGADILQKTKDLLSQVGYSIVTCGTGEEALAILEKEHFDVV